MKPILSVFADSPDQGQGQARDMPVRWAFEEVGEDYDVRPVPWQQFKEPAHRARNPFAQIPTLEEGGLTLFESGSIVLHIAECGQGLLPADPDARARAISWMFAAVTTIQMPIVDREVVEYLEGDKPWANERMDMVDDRIRGGQASCGRPCLPAVIREMERRAGRRSQTGMAAAGRAVLAQAGREHFWHGSEKCHRLSQRSGPRWIIHPAR